MSNCREYQEMISHSLDEELNESDRERLHAHVSECEECRRMLDAFTMLHETLSEDLVPAPESLAAAVMEQVRREPVSIKKARRYHIGRWVALAACIAIVAFTAFHFRQNFVSKNAASPIDASGYVLENKVQRADAFVGEMSVAAIAADAPMATEESFDESYGDGFDSNAVKESAECEPGSDAPQSLDYEGETYYLSDYLSALPESKPESKSESSIPMAAYAQDAAAGIMHDEGQEIRLINGRLYLLLSNGIWAVYEKE